MKAAVYVVLAFLLVSVTSCKKEDSNSTPYPVWIINLFVYEQSGDPANPLPPVRGNPTGYFHIEPAGKDTAVGPMQNTTNRIYIWQHIDGMVNIQYVVRCPNYYDSDRRQVMLSSDAAVQGPGRDGAEVIYTDTVRLMHH